MSPKGFIEKRHDFYVMFMYGIMTKELVIREIRNDNAAGQGDLDWRMTSFGVIMPLKLPKSTMKALL